MSGHAYGRAIRAHILWHQAIANIVWHHLDLSDEETTELAIIFNDMYRSAVLKVDNNCVKSVERKFRDRLVQIESNGPTAKLWVQYFRMISLLKCFIQAESMVDWQLHLETMQQMLPYFHACGHSLYAKSSHLYLQDMFALEEKMDTNEYDLFTREGYFTIRRSNKFWSGIWSDMTIEQTLMRTMKSTGGLTHGRGMTDSVLTTWTLGMVYMHNVCEKIEEFSAISLSTSEQHVDMRPTCITRDGNDVAKLADWLSQHNPFPQVDSLLSINSGVVGDKTLNCHIAQEIGASAMAKTMGNNFGSIKFKRKDAVLSLGAARSGIKVGNCPVSINPVLLFQRICIAKKSDEELKSYFKYELGPHPLSLFNEDGMRKGTKSSLYKAFSPVNEPLQPDNNILYVLDGGSLLHRMVWHRNDSYEQICMNYIQYIRRHYGDNATVVFDGYPTDAASRNTKSAERYRRSKAQVSTDVIFDAILRG